jgi:hypothetical protein
MGRKQLETIGWSDGILKLLFVFRPNSETFGRRILLSHADSGLQNCFSIGRYLDDYGDETDEVGQADASVEKWRALSDQI